VNKIISTAIALFFCCQLFAQQRSANDLKGFKFSGGLTLAVPTSNLPLWSVGAGADLLVQYGVIRSLAITGDAGFTNLFGRRKDLNSYTIVPVRAGLRFFPVSKLYLGAKTGVGFLKVKGVAGATALAYSIGAGYIFNKKLDVGVTYDGYSKDGTIGLMAVRVGYFFSND
jgi:hypothetical protein